MLLFLLPTNGGVSTFHKDTLTIIHDHQSSVPSKLRGMLFYLCISAIYYLAETRVYLNAVETCYIDVYASHGWLIMVDRMRVALGREEPPLVSSVLYMKAMRIIRNFPIVRAQADNLV